MSKEAYYPTAGSFSRARKRVLFDPRISPGAKALYCLLRSYCIAKDTCYPKIEKLAAALGCTTKQIHRWKKQLVNLRVITFTEQVIAGKQSTNLYSLVDDHFCKHLARKPHTKTVGHIRPTVPRDKIDPP